jgi:hypothetical protein
VALRLWEFESPRPHSLQEKGSERATWRRTPGAAQSLDSLALCSSRKLQAFHEQLAILWRHATETSRGIPDGEIVLVAENHRYQARHGNTRTRTRVRMSSAVAI